MAPRVAFVAALLLAWPQASQGQSSGRMTFVGVHLDNVTLDADRRLMDYLSQRLGTTFAPEDLEYLEVIRRLVNWKPADGAFVARMTPYAYVVSELLGASVDPVATYVSATTRRATYRSYFVVNRRNFPRPPSLADLLRFLVERPARARFVYHNQFSSSSFFLPSLYFRSHKVFQMAESTGPLTAITSDHVADAGSSTLVQLVAQGTADVAAVWDGVKARFETPGSDYETTGRHVHFVELPTALPNDLLVVSRGLDPATLERLRQAIAGMRPDEIAQGDFSTWISLNEATEARLALAGLRQAARERVAPVTVDVQAMGPADADAGFGALREAARQAVRLAGTEFVLYDKDFHGHIDFRWSIERIHDGAVVLTSVIPGSDLADQVFHLSFRDPEDLTARIVALVQSRMHRIRYVWPYSAGAPIVVRDSAVSIARGTPVKVQRITWIDPERNAFSAGPMFTALVADATFYRYELDRDQFARGAGSDARLDPMSNSAFRVILARPEDVRLLFRVLTGGLVACFVLAGLAAAWGLVVVGRRGSFESGQDMS